MLRAMAATALRRRWASFDGGRSPHISVARERPVGYDAGRVWPTVSPADAAIAQLESALESLAAVDWTDESDDTIRSASIGLQRLVNRVSAAALGPVEQLQSREAYGVDGAVTAASWLRNRANLDPATATRICSAAARLRRLPLLAEAFATGGVSFSHVAAVTDAAVPTRVDAICSVEAALVNLACRANPKAVRAAVKAVRDHVDPDGTDRSDEGDGDVVDDSDDDPRRYWHHSLTIDGLYTGNYLVGGILGELISTLFDAYSTADPADAAPTSRRSPAQQRVDAMRAALMALCNAGITPTIQGSKAHLLLMVDLLTLMGRDQAAVFTAELRRTGRVSPATIARLGLNAKITPVLTMGPWRTVAVGRTHRVLPPWLRGLMEMLHRHCRGPDCDRPAAWTQAAHETDYAKGGDTDLNQTIPLCKAHHDLITYKGWAAQLDLDSGICTWTTPTGHTITTHPSR